MREKCGSILVNFKANSQKLIINTCKAFEYPYNAQHTKQLIFTSEAWVAKLVDAADSKSSAYMNGKSGKIKNTTSMPEW